MIAMPPTPQINFIIGSSSDINWKLAQVSNVAILNYIIDDIRKKNINSIRLLKLQ